MSFLNRTNELATLGRLWRSRNAEFVVVYGRRRIGKTELLTRFGEDRRSIYFEATDVRTEDQLSDFARAYVLGLDLGSAVLAVESWEQALALLGEAAAGDRTLAVFDEFQYLAKQTEGLGSIISRWWREDGRNRDLVLVLAGSDVAFFAEEVLGANAPLHGRRTADFQVQAFTPRDARLFVPRWSSEDHIRTYGVWGGVPYYLHFLDDSRSVAENIFTTILAPGAPLANEAEYLIRMESRLRDVALYGSILRAIAAGKNTAAEIANRLQLDTGNLSRQIDRLQSVGLVRELRPVVQARRTDVLWEIADPFLRFWFRYVATAGAQIATEERARRYLQHTVTPSLDEFISQPTFEEICQQHLLHTSGAAAVGRWWGRITERDRGNGMRTVEREADAVAVDDNGRVIALGTCKWTNAPIGISEINKLRRIANHLEPDRQVDFYAYHRSGVDPAVEEEGINVVGPDEVFV